MFLPTVPFAWMEGDSIGIKGDIDFKMLNLGRDEISVLFETRVNEEKNRCLYF